MNSPPLTSTNDNMLDRVLLEYCRNYLQKHAPNSPPEQANEVINSVAKETIWAFNVYTTEPEFFDKLRDKYIKMYENEDISDRDLDSELANELAEKQKEIPVNYQTFCYEKLSPQGQKWFHVTLKNCFAKYIPELSKLAPADSTEKLF